jgi:hypothetical protein
MTEEIIAHIRRIKSFSLVTSVISLDILELTAGRTREEA